MTGSWRSLKSSRLPAAGAGARPVTADLHARIETPSGLDAMGPSRSLARHTNSGVA